MEVAEAFSLICKALDAGRPANGYVISGDLGKCSELAELVIGRLFPGDEARIAAKTHPDVAYLEPEGKKRIITVKSMRERIVEPMSSTSYSGGWKVGVISGADRMEAPSANAFLKSLEEPTPRTLYLLLTDSPDALLPTIVSRSQRVDLGRAAGIVEGEAYSEIREALEAHPPQCVLDRTRTGERLAEILAALKDDAEDADIPLVRKSFFRTVMSFARGWVAAGRLPLHKALANVEAVEEAYRRCEKSIGDEAALVGMVERMAFP